MEIPWIELYPHRMKNVENMGKISIMPLNKVQLSEHHFFTNLTITQQHEVEIYTEFHPN
jgi:hypothetical protein